MRNFWFPNVSTFLIKYKHFWNFWLILRLAIKKMTIQDDNYRWQFKLDDKSFHFLLHYSCNIKRSWNLLNFIGLSSKYSSFGIMLSTTVYFPKIILARSHKNRNKVLFSPLKRLRIHFNVRASTDIIGLINNWFHFGQGQFSNNSLKKNCTTLSNEEETTLCQT